MIYAVIIFCICVVLLLFITAVCVWELTDELKQVLTSLNSIKSRMMDEDRIYDELLDIEYRAGDTSENTKQVLAAITRFCEVNDENMLRVQELLEDKKHE